ncbi:MAG TPA: CAP domain-containing protein, partial [Flavobacterium sp.]|nr:CAP domain-containing protein [Flavobacterium sp.]
EYAGENLALQYTSSEEVQKAWMASPKHRANILNPNYEDVGYAIASGDFREAGSSQLYRGIIIVQLFGKRSSLANIGEPLQSPAQVASQVLGKTNIFALGQINNIVEDIKTSVFAAPAPIINIKAKQTVAVAKSSKPEPPPEPIPVTAWPMLGLGLAVMVGTHHLTTRFFL